VSHHLVNIAMGISLPGTPKWILCVLSHLATMSTGKVETTTADLALACGFSQSCVRDQLKRLERAGLIEAERLAKGALIIKVRTF
jgi:DNA-binding IscR family transcriptional regulator